MDCSCSVTLLSVEPAQRSALDDALQAQGKGVGRRGGEPVRCSAFDNVVQVQSETPTLDATPTLPIVKISVITMFPDYFEGPLQTSIVGRAIEDGTLIVDLIDLRQHGLGKHRQLDDAPFGGGPGMVMMVEPLDSALTPFAESHRVLFTPSGEPMTQATLDTWALLASVTFVCGRFEGVDQRVIDRHIDQEVSLGDYVLAGGEVVAAAAVEGIARLLPGVVGNPESTEKESFRDGLLEEPVYTRPAEYEGDVVPEILLSGDHAKIEEWRQEQRVRRTSARRPDLLSNGKESEN